MVITEKLKNLGVCCLEKTHVPLQEPSWNPEMEAEAIDQLYQLGQVNPVNVYRYYLDGTLQMNIHQVQRINGELELYVFLPSPQMFCVE